jgi:glutaredoxin
MINIQIITTEGCHQCAKAKELFKELQPKYPDMQIEEIDATTPKGTELVGKHGIFASPGIIINGELFSTGGLDRNDFIAKLDSL